MNDIITRKPTAVMLELLRKGAADERGIMTLFDPNCRTLDGIFRRDMADTMHEPGTTSSWVIINSRGLAYVAKLDAAEEATSAPQTAEEPPAAPVAPWAVPGVRAQCQAGKGKIIDRFVQRSGIETVTFVPDGARHGDALPIDVRSPHLAPEAAAPAPVEAPLAPVTDEFTSMGAAVDFLARLKVGERVRVTKDGRTNDYTVTRPARRYGPQGTTNVTVSIRPGGYAFEVAADHLFANRTGDKATWSFGGTKMSRTPMITPTTTEETPMAEPTTPAPKTVGPRLAAAYERRDAVLAAMDAGRAVEYLPAHKVMSRVFRQDVTGMRATRAYWVNANNGAEEVALRSTQEQARTYAHSFKALARVEHGPHACTLVFADGTTEELISYDVVCILPAA